MVEVNTIKNTERKKVAGNTVFYLLYQCILFVVPLLVMPYLTRVLSESSLGEYSFSYSIAYYFVLASNLGISIYGQREIASIKDDKEKLRRKFWSLFYVHASFSIIAFVAYLCFVFFSKSTTIYLFIIPYVISALFDVTWFFYGLEDFKLVTVVNGLFAIVKMFLIFIFVKSNDSLWIYQLISFGAILLSQLSIFGLAIKNVGKPVKVTSKECLGHLKPILYFALATIALTLYTYVDKTLLGVMVNDSKKSIAYYECADKLVAVPRTLITVLGIVLYPKMCSFIASDQKSKVMDYTLFSIDWTSFLSFGAIFGLLVLAVPFSGLYYGEGYVVSGYCMMLMSPLIFIISLGSICRTQYILPQKRDKVFLLSLTFNALTNVLLNVLLIPLLGVYGVVVASIASESVGLAYQLIACRNQFPFKYALKSSLFHLFGGFCMFIIVYGCSRVLIPDSWVKVVILFVIGLASYVLLINLSSSVFSHRNLLSRSKGVN